MAPSLFQAALSLMFVGTAFSRLDTNFDLMNVRAALPVFLQKRAAPIPASPLPTTWKYQGCYTENGPRTLASSGTSDAKMTAEFCIAFCKASTYAGVEYGQECYCGDAIGSTSAVAPATDCNMPCVGNSTQACGGPNRLTIYWNGQKPPPGPSTNPGVNGFGFLGCYTEGNGGRALGTGMNVGGGKATVALCVAACKAGGFSMAGVEYANECYCGNAFQNSPTIAPGGLSDCNMLCGGNSTEYCGAGNRLDVYQQGYVGSGSTVSSVTVSTTKTGTSSVVPPTTSATTSATTKPTTSPTTKPTTSPTTSPTATSKSSSAAGSSSSSSPTSGATGLPSGWKYAACYNEGTTGRALLNNVIDGNTNTIENCVKACIAAGYSVAGVEYSQQCFCDNSLNNGASTADESKCNMPCSGNAKENCGGPSLLNIYNTGSLTVYAPPTSQTTGLPGSWVYQGCYSDNVNGRALFWETMSTNNSATSCLTLCSNYGYMAAGLQYGDECYCGDDDKAIATGSTKQAETDCQIPCPGNKNYYCGGNNRNSYYKWVGNDIYKWATPTGNAAGSYQYLIGGVVIPLITTTGINKKVVFMEKSGTGAPNTTGTYELDLTFINDVSKAWRPLHVKSDIFCSAGITLPDKAGRQLNIGGWSGASTYGVRLYTPDGSPGVPGVNDWQENVAEVTLLAGRWYPSAMVMTNGSVFVLGGEVGSNSAAVPSGEILPPPPGGYAKYFDWLARTDPNNLYPFMFVLPSGGIFVVYYNEARILDEKTFDTVKTLPNLPGSVINPLAGRSYPLEGTAVMMPLYSPFSAPVTVMVCGGSANTASYAIDNCVSTQPEVAAPTWTLERMPSQRVMSCICALPDGTYLILNGAVQGVAGFGLGSGPNLNAVLYDPSKPVNQRMSIMGNTIVARLYHSEAMLLPDGRVMVSGSDPQDGTHPQEYRVEVFNPPYALSGSAKPSFTITTANKDWTYGGTAQITAKIPSGNLGAVRISMMAAVSSTHGNSMGQRTLFLSVSCTGAASAATCTMQAPPSAGVAPPGWYMIFVLDGPTPGEAEWVRIGGSIADAAGLGNWPKKTASFTPPGTGAVGS